MVKLNNLPLLASAFVALPLLTCYPLSAYSNESVDELLQLLKAQQNSLDTQQEQVNRLSREIMALKSDRAPVETASAEALDKAEPSKTTIDFYGVLDVSVSNTDSGFGNKTTIGSGGFSASRLGVSLKHSANDAFDIVAKAEAGFFLNNGSVGNAGLVPGTRYAINNDVPSTGGSNGTGAQIFAREAYAGIQGDFGRITLGRQYSGSYIASAFVGSAKGEGLYGYSTALIPRIGGMPTRANNSIVYITPKYKGFHAYFLATTGSENNVANDVLIDNDRLSTNDKAGRGFDVALFYSGERFNTALTTWNMKAASFVTDEETKLATLEGWMLASNFDFGPIIGYATYASGKISGGNYEEVTKFLSESDAWSISARLPLGNKHNLIATFTDFDDKSSLDQDAKLVGVGYWYDYTESTLFYTTWGKMLNGKRASYSLPDGANLVGRIESPGVDHSGVMVGMNYKF